MSDGFPQVYMQHDIPLSYEEQVLQRRRAYGDKTITKEMIDYVFARNLREHGREHPLSDCQIEILVKNFGENWRAL